MRITLGKTNAPQNEIDAVYDGVKQSFGFINKDVIEDFWKCLEDPESLKPSGILFDEILNSYEAGDLPNIFRMYDLHSQYAQFLKMLTKNPFYPKDKMLNKEFFEKMWTLLADLNRQQQYTRPRDSNDQKMTPEEIDFKNLIQYGQQVLDLLKDPLFNFQPPPPPAPQPQTPQDQDEPTEGDRDEEPQDRHDETEDDFDGDEPKPFNKERWARETASSLMNSKINVGASRSATKAPMPTTAPQHDPYQGLSKMADTLRHFNPHSVQGLLLSESLETVLNLSKKGSWVPTSYPDNNIDVQKIRDSKDLVKLLPSQQALPSEIFYLKYAKKELLTREFVTRVDQKQVAYVLLDSSGSMQGPKVTMAVSIILALLRRVVHNGDQYYLRTFDDKPHPLRQAHSVAEAQDVTQHIMRESFGGGGTDIQKAVMTAINDIQTKQTGDALKRCQILLITDGESNINAQEILQAKKSIKLHTAVIHGQRQYRDTLKQISDSFYDVKETGKQAIELVNVFNRR